MANEHDEIREIIMTDAETNAEMHMIIADTAEYNGVVYLLVYESGQNEDDETDAIIIKEIRESGSDVLYEQVTDDEELESVAAIFQESGGDYTVLY